MVSKNYQSGVLLLLTFLGSNIWFSQPAKAAILRYLDVLDTENFSSSQLETVTIATVASIAPESNNIPEPKNINNFIQQLNPENISSECSSPYPDYQFKDSLEEAANIRRLPQVEYSLILKEVYDFEDICQNSNNNNEENLELLLQNDRELQVIMSMRDYYKSPAISPQEKIELENEDPGVEYSPKQRTYDNYPKNYLTSYPKSSTLLPNYPSRLNNLPSQVNNYPSVSLVADLANNTPKKYNTQADAIHIDSSQSGNYGILAPAKIESYTTTSYENNGYVKIGQQIQENINQQLQIGQKRQEQAEKIIKKKLLKIREQQKQKELRQKILIQQERQRQTQMLIRQNKQLQNYLQKQ